MQESEGENDEKCKRKFSLATKQQRILLYMTEYENKKNTKRNRNAIKKTPSKNL